MIPTYTSGCCIRFYDKPEVHTNPGHINTAEAVIGELVDGERVIFDEDGRLIVRHFYFGPISTMGAFADETLVERGITAGLSGGNGRTLIGFANRERALDLNRASDYKLLKGTWSNLWLSWTAAQI